MQFICMHLHLVEVCTHCYIVWTESCRKLELHNWRNVPGDNLWSHSTTGNFRSLEVSITQGYVVRIISCVNGSHPCGDNLPNERK